MDFVHDAMLDGRAFWVLAVADQSSRWSPILELAPGMSGGAVAAALDGAIARHGKPMEDGFVESLNGMPRDDGLNANQFLSTEDVRSNIEL